MTRDRGPRKRSSPERAANAPRRAADDGDAPGEAVRLQKVMARAGIGSRRHCEELIAAGRVEIDSRTVTELGTKVLPDQEVRVDGVSLTRPRNIYYLVNKPTGVVSTNHDPAGRTRVVDLLPPSGERLFTVGRLDMSSEGLILVTNDGELANRLAHPRFGVEKTYQVLVAGYPDNEVLASLRRGVHLAEGLARAAFVRVKKPLKQSTILEIVLKEGKNREIRRVLAKVGHKVLRLKRIAIANLKLGMLPPGDFRRLTSEEVRALRRYRPSHVPRPAAAADQSPGKPRTAKIKPTPAKVRTATAGTSAGSSAGAGRFRPGRGAGVAVRAKRKGRRR